MLVGLSHAALLVATAWKGASPGVPRDLSVCRAAEAGRWHGPWEVTLPPAARGRTGLDVPGDAGEQAGSRVTRPALAPADSAAAGSAPPSGRRFRETPAGSLRGPMPHPLHVRSACRRSFQNDVEVSKCPPGRLSPALGGGRRCDALMHFGQRALGLDAVTVFFWGWRMPVGQREWRPDLRLPCSTPLESRPGDQQPSGPLCRCLAVCNLVSLS